MEMLHNLVHTCTNNLQMNGTGFDCLSPEPHVTIGDKDDADQGLAIMPRPIGVLAAINVAGRRRDWAAARM